VDAFIVAALIFAGLLVWVLAKDRGRVPEKGEVLKLKTEQCSALQVKTDTQSLSLLKQGDQWMLQEPVKGWADKDAAEKAINALARLKPTGSRKGQNLNDAKVGAAEAQTDGDPDL